jgi:hypothetical protein
MVLLLTEQTLFFHNMANSTEKPSGLLKVNLWASSVAKPCMSREQSRIFGPRTRDSASVHSRTTSVLSATAPTSMPTMSNKLESERGPGVVRTFGGLEDETDDLEDLRSVLGKWGSNMVRASILAATMCSQLSVSLPGDS